MSCRASVWRLNTQICFARCRLVEFFKLGESCECTHRPAPPQEGAAVRGLDRMRLGEERIITHSAQVSHGVSSSRVLVDCKSDFLLYFLFVSTVKFVLCYPLVEWPGGGGGSDCTMLIG